MIEGAWRIAIALVAGVLVGLIVSVPLRIDAYKRGYIDAATGQAGYDLVTHDDGSRTWEKSTTTLSTFWHLCH